MIITNDFCDHCGAILEDEDPVLVARDKYGDPVELTAEEAEDIEHDRLCEDCACEVFTDDQDKE
jgi:hypothetical protein